MQHASSIRVALNRPQRVIHLNRFKKGGINERGRLAFDLDLCASVGKLDCQLLARQSLGQVNVHSNVLQRLLPDVLVRLAAIASVRLYALVLFFILLLLGRDSSLPGLLGGFFSNNALCLFLSNFFYLCALVLLLRLSNASLFIRLCLELCLFALKRLLARLFLVEKVDIACQRFSHSCQSLGFLRKEVSLATHKTKQVVKEVVNPLTLLYDVHKYPVKSFVCHL